MFEIEEPKTKGLGRGLNALFEDAEIDVPAAAPLAPAAPTTTAVVAKVENEVISAAPGRKRMSLGVEQLEPSPFQPRRLFHSETLDELADSIREMGILQPLLVREKTKGSDTFYIIAGERRWQAAQRAQVHEVPVIILDITDLEAFKIALIENLQREDLDPIDEAYGYQRLLKEHGQTKEDLAKALGKSRAHISNTLRLLNLPDEVRYLLGSREISMGHARALVNAPDPVSLAKDIVDRGLSVRQAEKLAAEAQGREQKKVPRGTTPVANDAASDTGSSEARVRPLTGKQKDADTLALEKDMTNALGMRVSIDSSDGRSGTLSVEFSSLDQLDELLHRLAHFPGSRLSG